jgi:3-dehydroquinate synthase
VERVRVPIPGREYEVTIGGGILERAGSHLPDLPGAERAFVVADAAVADRYLEPLERGLAARELACVHLGVPEGEEAKSLQTVTALHRQLATQEAHRDDVVVALGGGAVGDLAGFVAATYMRGVRFVQVPTTLTAQVDAAIGGKTAVNLPEGKNLVGAFHQPVAVLADVATLATLPDREFRAGLAEVAKYALTLDLALLERLERDPGPVLVREPDALEDLVARCVRAKASVVGQDERDAGRRLVLNYGHTLGHALERLDAFAGRSHGEAVAIGMVFAARLAESEGLAPAGLAARHARLLASLGLETDDALPPAEEILAAMRMDKKYRGGVRFVLLEDVGRPTVVDSVPEARLRGLLEHLRGAEVGGSGVS